MSGVGPLTLLAVPPIGLLLTAVLPIDHLAAVPVPGLRTVPEGVHNAFDDFVRLFNIGMNGDPSRERGRPLDSAERLAAASFAARTGGEADRAGRVAGDTSDA